MRTLSAWRRKPWGFTSAVWLKTAIRFLNPQALKGHGERTNRKQRKKDTQSLTEPCISS